MGKLFGIFSCSAFAVLFTLGRSAHAQIQAADSFIHPAPASQVITVKVKDYRRFAHDKEQGFVVAQAAGFSTDICDVITTFDVVKAYEVRQTWRGVRQEIEIEVNGKSYPAQLRDFGFYPLGLNLACIDFQSPLDRADSQLAFLPLDQDSNDSSSLSYVDSEIARSDPGTPFLNQRGEISSVLIATPNGPLEFASADDIRRFLQAASSASPSSPVLRRRPLSAT
jgi:hypothetical protein